MDKPLAWGDAQTVKYLSEKLQESHRIHSGLIRERDHYQVMYEVLRDLALEMVTKWGNGNDEERLLQRFKEVLGLTTETQPLESLEQENRTHDYQTGWAEDGPIPTDETPY